MSVAGLIGKTGNCTLNLWADPALLAEMLTGMLRGLRAAGQSAMMPADPSGTHVTHVR